VAASDTPGIEESCNEPYAPLAGVTGRDDIVLRAAGDNADNATQCCKTNSGSSAARKDGDGPSYRDEGSKVQELSKVGHDVGGGVVARRVRIWI
jgi:hypothetical protein